MNWTVAFGALCIGAFLVFMGTRSSKKSLLKPWFFYIGGILFVVVFLGALWPRTDTHRYDPTFGLPKEIASYIPDLSESSGPAYDDLKVMEGWTWASADDGWTVADFVLVNGGEETVVDFKVDVLLYDSSGEYIGSMMRRFMEALPPGGRRSCHIEGYRPKRAYDAKIHFSEIRTANEESLSN